MSRPRLYWNESDGRFRDGTLAAGVGSDENGMGSTFGDVDGDGDLDWFVTSIHPPDAGCLDRDCAWSASGLVVGCRSETAGRAICQTSVWVRSPHQWCAVPSRQPYQIGHTDVERALDGPH